MSCCHRRFVFLPLVCVAFVLSSFASEITAAYLCLPDQSSALLQLKRSFSSSKPASWRHGTDCCGWDGITCDQGTGQVTALDLSNRFISGELGSSLFNLTSLRYLNLAYNLFDQIPLPASGFGKLSDLIYLNLSNAGFVGQVPGDIAQLTNLVSLDLSTFYLNEEPNSSITLQDPSLGKLIANLSNLQELYLDGVNISADGIEWCRVVSESAPGLRELSLTGCSLVGPIDSSLSRLQMLSKLCLDQNNLSSSVPEFFAEFSYLTVLRLSSCELNGVFPGRIFQLRSLTVIDASENPMLSGQFPEFPKGSALESLVLSNTNFSGGIPESVGNLKSLRNLQLMSCNFSGAMPSSLENLTQLVHLDLSSNNFSGEIPSIVQWHGISDIILANNRLTGSLPSSKEYVGLQNLTKIDLRNNSLVGLIPVSLFALPSLQLLQLSRNQFSGYLKEFSNASSMLQTVDLSNNNLQGPIPRSVFQLLGLRVLTLASNNFSGILEIGIFRNLRNLSNLDLSSNILSIVEGDDNSSFASFPKISTLKLVSCNLTKLPAFLRYQDGISILDLSNNKISGAIPKWIWNIGESSYSNLNLSYNMFTSVEGPLPNLSAIPTMFLDFHANKLRGFLPLPPPNTIVLDYSSNIFTSSLPSDITSYLSYTVFFSLSNNSLTGEIPPSICNASYLQVLDLSNNGLSGSIPSCLLKGSNDLRILNLRGNLFSGTLPQDISQGCVLRAINLNSNKLEGRLPRSLANCDMLEILDIGNNHIVDTFPYFLGNLSQLRVLVLRSNGFYGPILNPTASQLINSPLLALQIFDISSNHFNGSLPMEYFKYMKAMMVNSDSSSNTMGFSYLVFSSSYYQNSVTVTFKGLEVNLVRSLVIFTSLDLSSNGFEGSIPDDIGELKLLFVLNMSHNSLKGEIPSQLGELVQLESLDLSSNQLSGQIPQGLTALTFLSCLNVSYNNLTGMIPQDRQFSTFSNTSYLGNEGLCGLPLSNQCGATTAMPVSKSKLSALMSSINLNWQFIFTGVGFGGGLAMVVCPLMVWSEGRGWYNKHADRMLLAILPVWLCNACGNGNGKVGAEEGDNDSKDEEEKVPKFCLFCTGLEFSEERMIIHHVECSCHTLDEYS